VCDATKSGQLDVRYVGLEQPADERVPQLVKQDRDKQADDDDKAGRHELGVVAGKVGVAENDQHQHEHHIQVDRDAGDAADLDARKHIFSPGDRARQACAAAEH
jgi:hypothetical protein